MKFSVAVDRIGWGVPVLVAAVALVAVTPVFAREPRITVPSSRLGSALFCQSVTHARRTPVLLVTGTGLDGSEVWPQGLQVSLTRAGIPSCYVNFPHHTTGDMQIAVQYLVYAIRTVRRKAGREIALYGVSQGALLPRFALLYWPSLRRMVSDAVLVAGTQHGTTTFGSLLGSCSPNCRFPAGTWQQAAGSNLLRAINRKGRKETPGPTSWTTVRSLTDEVVQPTSGPHATSALKGATNLVIQSICPGRQTSHIGTGIDSVSYAALIDAITHRGPAKAGRISRNVCRRLYAPGLDPQRAAAGIAQAYALATPRTLEGADGGVLLSREPRVRAWVRTG